MTMHEDLFAQAEMLAKVDAKKPKQVNLRRAVSSAYYGLFHFLTEEACIVVFGTQNSLAVYRHTLGRAFVHTVMRQACASFAGGTLKDSVIKALPRDAAGRYPIDAFIREIARAFTDLQEQRTNADYDRNRRFKRSDVLVLIDKAKEATAKFSALTDSADKRFFLACLWAWKELASR